VIATENKKGQTILVSTISDNIGRLSFFQFDYRVTAVFLVTAVDAVYVPVAPRAFFDAFFRPAASSLVGFAFGRNAIGFVRAIVAIYNSVADGRRIVHVRQSRFTVAELFVSSVLAVHSAVAAVVRQHILSYSEKLRRWTNFNIIHAIIQVSII